MQVARKGEYIASPDFESNRFIDSLMWLACSVPSRKDNFRVGLLVPKVRN